MFVLFGVVGRLWKKKEVNTRPKTKEGIMLASVSRLQIPYHRRLFEFVFF